MESAASTEGSNPLLLKRLADPQTLRHWLVAIETQLKAEPADRTLSLQRANLLRALGELGQAREAFAATPPAPSPDPARERPLAILSELNLGWTDAAGPAPFLRLDNFLSDQRRAEIWDIVRCAPVSRAEVTHGGVGEVDPAIRQAHIVGGAARIRDWFLALIEAAVEQKQVLPRLGLAPVTLGKRELQITGHGDGDFFHMHKDRGEKNLGRYLTYVYYFHRLPPRFHGGELFLYDQDSGGRSSGPIAFTRLPPQDNSLILFPSDRWHAVGEVTMDSADPLDGRWTINGWLHGDDDMPSSPD